jgi:hypothetical protein
MDTAQIANLLRQMVLEQRKARNWDLFGNSSAADPGKNAKLSKEKGL